MHKNTFKQIIVCRYFFYLGWCILENIEMIKGETYERVFEK